MLSRLWQAGAAVPYPVQLLGTQLMMEFIGDDDGVAAPRLAQLRPDRDEAANLYAQMRDVLGTSPMPATPTVTSRPTTSSCTIRRLVLIDLPQAVDLVGNPQGFSFLRRDCDNICAWFQARGDRRRRKAPVRRPDAGCPRGVTAATRPPRVERRPRRATGG